MSPDAWSQDPDRTTRLEGLPYPAPQPVREHCGDHELHPAHVMADDAVCAGTPLPPIPSSVGVVLEPPVLELPDEGPLAQYLLALGIPSTAEVTEAFEAAIFGPHVSTRNHWADPASPPYLRPAICPACAAAVDALKAQAGVS